LIALDRKNRGAFWASAKKKPRRGKKKAPAAGAQRLASAEGASKATV
jgi:hypothetical protein